MNQPPSPRRSGLVGFAVVLSALVAFVVPIGAMADEGPGGSGSGSETPVSVDPGQAPLPNAPSDALCPGDRVTPFLPWGDQETYTLVPGGSFEPSDLSDSDWFGSEGAEVSAGNEAFYVGGNEDVNLLSLPAGSSVTSAPICVSRDHPNFRLFARGAGSPGARLGVEVLFVNGRNHLRSPQVGTVRAGDLNWHATPQFPVIANAYLDSDETTEIELRFTPIGGRSSWSIDDVYIDPRHRN